MAVGDLPLAVGLDQVVDEVDGVLDQVVASGLLDVNDHQRAQLDRVGTLFGHGLVGEHVQGFTVCVGLARGEETEDFSASAQQPTVSAR